MPRSRPIPAPTLEGEDSAPLARRRIPGPRPRRGASVKSRRGHNPRPW